MFERFTEPARRDLVLAQEEARTLGHAYLAPEHLLLGMLRDGRGIAARALSEAGVDYDSTRRLLEDSALPPEHGSSRQPFSNDLKQILEKSLRMSMSRGDATIGPEHLLLGLLSQRDETTTALFGALGIDPDEIVRRVEDILAERRPPSNPVIGSRLPGAVALVASGDPVQRLEVLEGVLWGIDHLGEVVEVMRGSTNRWAARDVLMSPPFSLTHNQATGVVDLSVDSVTEERRQQVVEEIEALRRQVGER